MLPFFKTKFFYFCILFCIGKDPPLGYWSFMRHREIHVSFSKSCIYINVLSLFYSTACHLIVHHELLEVFYLAIFHSRHSTNKKKIICHDEKYSEESEKNMHNQNILPQKKTMCACHAGDISSDHSCC
jgi:hypothetical protein